MNFKDYPVITAIVTPFNDDNTIDFESLEKLAKKQESSKNGILILGSTGESLNIDANERSSILSFFHSLNLKVPTMVGVGGINLNETKAWIDEVEKFNFDSLLLVTPLYAKPGEEGQYLWFKELMDHTKLPCMLYNIPGRTACALNKAAAKRLVGHPKFKAIKEASGSLDDFKDYRSISNDLYIYSGDDALTPLFSRNGGNGVVSVASNVWPEETNKIIKSSLKNELTQIEEKNWALAANALFVASNPVPVKALLKEQGVIKNELMRAPLCASDLKTLEPLIKADTLIKNLKIKDI